MEKTDATLAKAVLIDRGDLSDLFKALRTLGYQLMGPTVQDEAIVYDTVEQVEDLPIGITDEQEKGSYRLRKRNDARVFGYNASPHAWKKVLFPARVKLWETERNRPTDHPRGISKDPKPMALLGVRACELNAIRIQDRILMNGEYQDAPYARQRRATFVIGVDCAQAGGTCFCASMGTGPDLPSGYDIALTELLDKTRHVFLAYPGTPRGLELLERVPHQDASLHDVQQAKDQVAETAQHMGRTLDTTRLKDLFYEHLEHPHWEDVASRCLSCANCTMVCPTCFCTTVEETSDLKGNRAERWRTWDSCFTLGFSYLHGGSVRQQTRSQYRQWLTHKLSTWQDQFGTTGCVGCGRCITWCPVGIDLTEEAKALLTPKTNELGSD